MRLSLARPLLLALLGAAVGSATANSVFAMQGCPTPDYLEVWVDPFRGDDANGAAAVGTPTLPLATLNGAITVLRGAGADPTTNGIVHALPGLYASDNPTPQTFPIEMRPYIHLQGAGAKECVLRVRPGPTTFTYSPYWPLTTGLGRRPGSTIAVDFTFQTQLASPSMFDGFTIQGADIQVYAETEAGSRSGIVSNCVFDMRHGGYELLEGPFFGVMVAAIYFGENGIDYFDMPFYLFNNTFLQGVLYGEDDVDVDLSRPDSVAICNLNDPAPPCSFPICLEDPDPTIRGVSDLHIQNNLIRCLDGAPRTAMLGIGSDDTQVIVSSRPGTYDSNAFDAAMVGGASVPGGVFSSAIPLDAVSGAVLTPVPAVNLTAADPGFVGEFLSDTSAPPAQIRDARLLPDSVLLDMGASPAWDGGCTAPFQAGNLLLYTDVTRDSALSSFDFDGDGHGNLRIVGDDVDIGFHEIDIVTQAGSFGNDTKSHHLPYDTTLGVDSLGIPRIPAGTPNRDYVFGAPTLFAHLSQMYGFNPAIGQVWTTTGPWTHMPGSVAFPTNEIAPGAPIGLPGLEIWLDFFGLFTGLNPQQAVNAGSFSTTLVPWTNLESGQVHGPNVFRWVLDENVTSVPATHFTQQLVLFNALLGQFVGANHLAEYL